MTSRPPATAIAATGTEGVELPVTGAEAVSVVGGVGLRPPAAVSTAVAWTEAVQAASVAVNV